jgi:hypothetical protein
MVSQQTLTYLAGRSKCILLERIYPTVGPRKTRSRRVLRTSYMQRPVSSVLLGESVPSPPVITDLFTIPY